MKEKDYHSHENFLAKLSPIRFVKKIGHALRQSANGLLKNVDNVAKLLESLAGKVWLFFTPTFRCLLFIICIPATIAKGIFGGIKLCFSKTIQFFDYCRDKLIKMFSRLHFLFRKIIHDTKTFVSHLFAIAISILLSPYTLSKKLIQFLRNIAIKCLRRIAFVIKQIPSLILKQLRSWRDQVLGVVRSPLAVMSLAFTIVALYGLRVYDNQISKIEYSRGRLTAKRAKTLLMQRHYVLHGYENENIQQREKNHGKHLAVASTSAKAFAKESTENDTNFETAVDDFLRNHEISEVICEQGFCRMKIDGKMVDMHSQLAIDLEIFIADSDGERVTFADLAGHQYSKPIENFLSK
ncbi:MAG: hypothetical protein LBI56_01090 [Puniceicoccales bacterium]|jgi:hypothetical protein|nr:hypothetical protein [Puniceicoccales bacterium]